MLLLVRLSVSETPLSDSAIRSGTEGDLGVEISKMGVCHESALSSRADVTASGMGVWPPGIGLQGLISNHLMLLRSKDVVVSDEETADSIRKVCDEKVSASEPLLTRRNGLQTLSKQEAAHSSWISVGATCLRTTRQPAYRRHELIAGPDAEHENLPWHAKGTPQVATTTRANCVFSPGHSVARNSPSC